MDRQLLLLERVPKDEWFTITEAYEVSKDLYSTRASLGRILPALVKFGFLESKKDKDPVLSRDVWYFRRV